MENRTEATTARLLTELRPGRWGRTFHIFDPENHEVTLQLPDAVRIAKEILRNSKPAGAFLWGNKRVDKIHLLEDDRKAGK